MAFHKEINFNQRILLPGNQLFCGSSQSGKTTLFLKSLENVEKFYFPKPDAVYFLYQVYQEQYADIKKKLEDQGVKAEFHQNNEVKEEDLKAMMESSQGKEVILAIDDSTLATSSSQTMAHLFTISRHYHVRYYQPYLCDHISL